MRIIACLRRQPLLRREIEEMQSFAVLVENVDDNAAMGSQAFRQPVAVLMVSGPDRPFAHRRLWLLSVPAP